MSEPWLTIIGIGEDGLAGLTHASRLALEEADAVFGGPRHLDLAEAGPKGHSWPMPFDIAPVLARRGQPTVLLASGDPFWHGAGSSVTAHLSPGEWRTHPAPSTFSLAAARLGWRLEDTLCLGLHAAPFVRLRPLLQNGAHLICLVRDGEAPAALAAYLTEVGFGASDLHILEAIGGPRERITQTVAEAFACADVVAPVAVAIDAKGVGLPRVAGLPDDLFAHDGQITKRPVRAITLSSLGPRPGEHLWDLGAGSGSVSIEWALAGGTVSAVEVRPGRAANIRTNAEKFGLGHKIIVTEGRAMNVLDSLPKPDAIFVGGGGSADLFDRLVPLGARIVANGVTLETEALLTSLHAAHGGSLMRIDIAEAAPLGPVRGWVPARPIVQWSFP